MGKVIATRTCACTYGPIRDKDDGRRNWEVRPVEFEDGPFRNDLKVSNTSIINIYQYLQLRLSNSISCSVLDASEYFQYLHYGSTHMPRAAITSWYTSNHLTPRCMLTTLSQSTGPTMGHPVHVLAHILTHSSIHEPIEVTLHY